MTDKKHSVFIIDDDSFLLDMYAMKFTQSGFEVLTALGSEPALQKLEDGYNPDVILLDIVMPAMNGFELLKKMTEMKLATGSIKIALSNRGAPSDIKQGTDLGVTGYIVKANMTPAEVINKVKEYVEDNERRKQK